MTHERGATRLGGRAYGSAAQVGEHRRDPAVRSRVEVQLGEDVADVLAHRRFAYDEYAGDRAVGPASTINAMRSPTVSRRTFTHQTQLGVEAIRSASGLSA
jgi:hypothetical protein